MPARTDDLDLGGLRLTSGESRSFDLTTRVAPLHFGAQTYVVEPDPIAIRVDVDRTTGHGYALRVRFTASLRGPCMRCLEAAGPSFDVDAREIEQPGSGDELSSPYVTDEVLDVDAWVNEALALALPTQLLCRADCAGLCARCGANLNEDPTHAHEAEPDPRWAKLGELRLDG